MESADKDSTNISSSTTKNRSLAATRKKRIGVSLLVLLLAALGISFLYNHNQTSRYSYHYDKTTPFALPGSGKGYGLTFNKPNPYLNNLPGIKQSQSFNAFVQRHGDVNNGVVIGYMAVQSRKYTPKLSLNINAYKGYVKSLMQQNNISSQGSLSTDDTTKQLTHQMDIYGERMTLGPSRAFTSTNITDNAWQYDITATDITGKSPSQQGKALYILGGNGWYWFFVTAEKNNWQKNTAFFQQVLNSVKVDQ